MFISSYEKELMRVSIRTLQAQMAQVMDELKTLKANQKPKRAPQVPIVRTGEAPWGYKKDGTPKKRPGRPLHKIPEIKNEQSLPV
jgi:hypothetical protein